VYISDVLTRFVTGSITGIGGARNALIIAEYFTVTNPNYTTTLLTQTGTGIGKVVVIATNNSDYFTLLLAVVSMMVLIVAFNLTVWRRDYHQVTKRHTYNR
jgi:ABC-type anion transport system duplicated permease subunit